MILYYKSSIYASLTYILFALTYLARKHASRFMDSQTILVQVQLTCAVARYILNQQTTFDWRYWRAVLISTSMYACSYGLDYYHQFMCWDKNLYLYILDLLRNVILKYRYRYLPVGGAGCHVLI